MLDYYNMTRPYVRTVIFNFYTCLVHEGQNCQQFKRVYDIIHDNIIIIITCHMIII